MSGDIVAGVVSTATAEAASVVATEFDGLADVMIAEGSADDAALGAASDKVAVNAISDVVASVAVLAD